MGKRGCWVIPLILFFLFEVAYGETPDSFRGVKWGIDKSEVPDLVSTTAPKGNLEIFKRKEEKKIGDIEVEDILYFFYKNKFCSSTVKFVGYSNFSTIKEGLFQKYGRASRPNRYLEKYYWDLGDVAIILKYSEINKEGQIFYYYHPIMKQQQRDRKESGRKAKDDL